jgi:hypothetical protein
MTLTKIRSLSGHFQQIKAQHIYRGHIIIDVVLHIYGFSPRIMGVAWVSLETKDTSSYFKYSFSSMIYVDEIPIPTSDSSL